MSGHVLREFFALRPVQGAHRVAGRAAVSVLVPQLAVLALDRPHWSPYAAFGAFASLYARNSVHLSRASMQASAGAALTAAVCLGVVVGSVEEREWTAVVVAACVAALGSMLAAAQDWHPPGPLFLLFGFGATASVPHELGDLPVAAAVAGASAAFSVVVGNIGSFLRGTRSPPVTLAPVWTWEPAKYGVAALVGGGVATAAGIGHPYWATVAAVAPLSVRGVSAQLLRAGHRVVGTLLGLATSAALLALGMGPIATVLTVGLLQFVTELVVGRNYGVAMLFITPLALLMGQVAAPRPMGDLLFDRGTETVIGAAVAVAVVALGAARRRRAQRPRPAPR
jgi:hypothetical protein